MSPLDRKLLRDLKTLRGQVLAIALVMACGVATFVMSLSTLASLEQTRTAFYRAYRFAEVFAAVKRAPEQVGRELAEIPGVRTVELRVKAGVTLEVPGYDDPVRAEVVSLPDDGEPVLNRVFLRTGRMPQSGRDGEVLVSDSFAETHGLRPSDHLVAVINGRRQQLTIVGVALSPEYVYQVAPGELFPDFERFGIVWMERSALATAYNMEGAFNDVALTLYAGATPEAVIEHLDAALAPYGGRGAYPRAQQPSHFYLSEEFRQLRQTATLLPAIFLGVAAFLLNVVVSRLVSTQREQIAILKAFGYGNGTIGLHFLKLVLVIAALGTVAGVVFGVWAGQAMSDLYVQFYRLPNLQYVLPARVLSFAVVITAGAAVFGTVFAVRRAVVLPPAEAMRPEPPAVYRATVIERLGLQRWLGQGSRMILRSLERRPLKAMLSVTGIACACAILIMGDFFGGALDYMVQVHFGLSQREDVAVTFVEPTSRRALHELEGLPGVQYGQPFRVVPATLRFEHRTYRTAVQGLVDGDLQRVLDADLDPVRLPPDGVVLSEAFGDLLGVQPGDWLTLEVLEGSRPVHRVRVERFVRQFIGLGAYMELGALNRLMREGDAVSGVQLAVDAAYEPAILKALQARPRVAGIGLQKRSIEAFYDTVAEQQLIFAFFITLFAGAIAFGVVYNSARITLSERSRELASLRVLGLRRSEVAYILLGELAVLTLLAIPFGFLLGWGLCFYMVSSITTELFRIPMVMTASTYAFAALTVIVAALVSGLLVRRRLYHLDLIAVLKTRE